jgi:hypothetical protein
MKWILIAAGMVLATGGEAIAADLPPLGLPSPQSPVFYNWTGFYVGINAGYGTGTSNWADGPLGSTGGFPTSGFLAGGTVGANYQIGQYVFGIEGDGGWTNLRGNSGSTCGGIAAVVPPPVSCQTQSDSLGMVRGRVGYAFDCILVYGIAERANRLGPGSAPKETSGICVFATHDLDTAGIGHEQAGKQLEERCLAGTIRTEQRNELRSSVAMCSSALGLLGVVI